VRGPEQNPGVGCGNVQCSYKKMQFLERNIEQGGLIGYFVLDFWAPFDQAKGAKTEPERPLNKEFLT
jgi:hypothetical protein